MKEQAHPASEFLKFDGESGTEGLHMIYTDDQKPLSGDLVVIVNPQGKVFAEFRGDPTEFWEEGKRRGLWQVLRVSRVTYQ